MGTDYMECGKTFSFYDLIKTFEDEMRASKSFWQMTKNAVRFSLFFLPLGVGLQIMMNILGPSPSGLVPFPHGEIIWGFPILCFVIGWPIFFFVDFLLPRKINRRLRKIIAGIADSEPEGIHYPAQFRFTYKGHVFESNYSSYTAPGKKQSVVRHRFLTLSYYYYDHHYQWRTYESPLFQSSLGEYTEYFTHDGQRLMANIALKKKKRFTEDVITNCLDKLIIMVDENTVARPIDITPNFFKESRSVRLDHATLTFDGKACKISMTRKERIDEMKDKLFSSGFLRYVGFTFLFACAWLYYYAVSICIIVSALSYIFIIFLMKDLRDLSCRTIPYEDLSYIILDEDEGCLQVDYKCHTVPRSQHLLIEYCDIDELKSHLPVLSKHIEKSTSTEKKKDIWPIPIGAAFFSLCVFFLLKVTGVLTKASILILILTVFIWTIYAIVKFINSKSYGL